MNLVYEVSNKIELEIVSVEYMNVVSLSILSIFIEDETKHLLVKHCDLVYSHELLGYIQYNISWFIFVGNCSQCQCSFSII